MLAPILGVLVIMLALILGVLVIMLAPILGVPVILLAPLWQWPGTITSTMHDISEVHDKHFSDMCRLKLQGEKILRPKKKPL